MPIVASEIVEDAPQIDGRRWITERHVDHLGREYTRTYRAEADADAVAALPGYAAQLAGDLLAAEVAGNLARVAVEAVPYLSFEYSTPADLAATLRAAYAAASGVAAVLIGAHLDTLADAELASLFGYASPSADLAALRDRLASQTVLKASGAAATGL